MEQNKISSNINYPNPNKNSQEESDEELDHSGGSSKGKEAEIEGQSHENQINEDEDEDDFIEQKNISFAEDEEEGMDFIDFNNDNAYDSDPSQENLEQEGVIEINESGGDLEAEEKEEEDVKNTATELTNVDQNQPEVQNKIITNNPQNKLNENENQNNNINNQIKSNILAKKNSATSRLKTLKKKKHTESDKRKKLFEDPRETKTIFSKISEEIFYKLSKDKYKKTSAYDYMTDDIYINRVVQKSDQENKNKFNNFLERNNEFFNKKKLRLNEKVQKITEQTNSNLYAIPNKKVFNKDELRNPEQFFEDQKNFVLQKQQYVDEQREEKVKKNLLDARNNIPEINKNSKNIAEKKINDKVEVFDRLHNQRNYKEKQIILNEITSANDNNNSGNYVQKDNENKDKNKKLNGDNNNVNNRVSLLLHNKIGYNNDKHGKPALRLKGVKKPKSQMHSYSKKLHDDAKKLQAKIKEKEKEYYPNETQDLQCKKTKLMNIQKFLKSFNKNIKLLMGQKNNDDDRELNAPEDNNNLRLDFTDYCILLRSLGFIKNDYDTIKSHLENAEFPNTENNLNNQAPNNDKKADFKELNEKLVNPNKKPKLIQKLIKSEALSVLDSWRVLLSKAPQKAGEINEISEVEDVEQKDVLLFLCVVQGFLKGDINKLSQEEEKEMQQIKANKILISDKKKNGKRENKSSKSIDKANTLKANLNNLNNESNLGNKIPNSDLSKIKKNLVLSDDEDNSGNKKEFEAFSPPTGEYNKFKRVRSKDSVNKFMKKSSEINSNLDENVENKYKRKKSKNNENFVSNNNDKEMNIPVNKFFGNDKNAKESQAYDTANIANSNNNKAESRFRSIMKSASKEKQRSLSNKKAKQEQNSSHRNILTEENSEGFKNPEKKTEEKIDDFYILNKFFKFVELKNYPYNRTLAKKIKTIFRLFLENRTDFITHSKRQKVKDKNDSDSEASPAADKIKQPNPNEKINNKLYYERFKKKVMNQLENEMTFKPELNTSTNQSNINTVVSNKRKMLKMEDAYEYQKKKKESELMKIRMIKEQEEMKDCTFQPNTDQPNKLPKNLNLNSLVDKLYKEGLSQIKEKKELAKKHEEEKIEKGMDPTAVTFKPTTIPLNESIFNPKKIEAYEVSKKNVERFERARIEKKIAEIQKQTGITNLNQINNIDTLLKENNYPSWNFSLEKKTHKDTFDDPSRFSKASERKNEHHQHITNTFNTINTLTNSLNYTNTNPNTEQVIILDVNLNDESSVKKLKIGLNDDPNLIADEFAKKYDLSEDKKLKLIMLIEEKISENKRVNTYESKQSTAKKLKN